MEYTDEDKAIAAIRNYLNVGNKAKWTDDYIKENFAIAITRGILNYYSMSYKAETNQTTTTGKLYRVQVGAFSVKANAEKLANELKQKGYNTIIV